MGKLWQSLRATARMQLLFFDTVFDHRFATRGKRKPEAMPGWPDIGGGSSPPAGRSGPGRRAWRGEDV